MFRQPKYRAHVTVRGLLLQSINETSALMHICRRFVEKKLAISAENRLLGLAPKRDSTPARPSKEGFYPTTFGDFTNKDKLVKVGRGIYAIPSINLTEH
jgi:hypothetical protein